MTCSWKLFGEKHNSPNESNKANLVQSTVLGLFSKVKLIFLYK